MNDYGHRKDGTPVTAFYIGSVVNPAGHLHGLPVAIVNQDRSAPPLTPTGSISASRCRPACPGSPSVTDPLGLADTSLCAAEQAMDRERGSYAAVVIPADFTASLLELAGEKASGPGYARPVIMILTDQRARALKAWAWPPARGWTPRR